jgi:fatty acid/phospholipid biosynthesis enzyme
LYERPASIPLSGDVTGTTAITRTAIDTSTAITTRAIAIQDAVAQGIRDTTTASMRVYDATLLEGTQVPISVTATGATATQTFGTVAVTLIDESTLFD